MSRNFELLQQTSSDQDLFETAGNPAGLVGTAECEPSPTWSEKPELFETAGNPAGLVGTAECEPRPRWTEKPEQQAVRSEAPSIHLPELIREKTRNWGQQVRRRYKERRSDLESISREEEIKLVHRIFPAGGQCSPQIVLFSAVESDAGCASISIRTAEILAGRGDGSVCVVDANFQLSCLHHYFGIDNSKGLAEAVLGSLPIQDFLQKHPEANLWILPCGAAAGQLRFSGVNDRLRSRMAELRGQFKYVVIHSSPLDLDSASMLLSRWTDGVVMVVEADTTRRATARRMKQDLEAANVRILGVVLNNRTFSIPEVLYRRL